MTIQVTWQSNIFHIEFSGSVTPEELEKVHVIWSSDYRSDVTKCVICDFLNADLTSISTRNAIECSARDKGASITIPKVKIALVARDKSIIDLCKAYIDSSMNLASTWEFSMFYNVDDAFDWGITD